MTPPASDFLCPISRKIMTDPVVTVQGVSFQRDAILKRLETHSTCPVTGTTLIASSLLTNTKLQWKILYWKSKNDPVEQEEEKEEAAPLQRFLCPLTRTIMQDPVTIREGHTFERSALLNFIENYGKISPNSGKPLGAPCFYASKKLSWEIRHWQIDMQTPAEAETEETNETPVEASVVDREQPAKQQQEPVQTTIKSRTITIPSTKKMSPETSPHRGSISRKFIQNAGILGSSEEQDVLSILTQACSLQIEETSASCVILLYLLASRALWPALSGLVSWCGRALGELTLVACALID
jgi:hypothetical protein